MKHCSPQKFKLLLYYVNTVCYILFNSFIIFCYETAFIHIYVLNIKLKSSRWIGIYVGKYEVLGCLFLNEFCLSIVQMEAVVQTQLLMIFHVFRF